MSVQLFIISVLLFACTYKVWAIDSDDALYNLVCGPSVETSEDPWHITNLYNCYRRELYIPYQLWTGARWDGDKEQGCMHAVERHSVLKQQSAQYAKGRVRVRGPIEWKDSYTGEVLQVWERFRPETSSRKYYACHARGIGPVHNPLKERSRYIRGLCRAPGGHGWRLQKKRVCIKTTLKIIALELDKDYRLKSLSVDYWFRDKLRYRYLYQPNQGATEIFLHRS